MENLWAKEYFQQFKVTTDIWQLEFLISLSTLLQNINFNNYQTSLTVNVFCVCLSWKLPILNCNNHNSNYDYHFASFQRSKLACGLRYCFRYFNHLTNLDMNYLIDLTREKYLQKNYVFFSFIFQDLDKFS